MLRVFAAAVTVDGKEGNDNHRNDAACYQHQMLFGQFLLLHLVLSVGNRQFRVKLIHLCSRLRRLDGLNHRACLFLPVERLFPVTHVLVNRCLLRTFILHVYQFLGTLQGQLPLLAVLGLIYVDKFAEESALTAVLGNQLGTFFIGLCETALHRKDYEEVKEYARKALEEPGIIPMNKITAWSYKCLARYNQGDSLGFEEAQIAWCCTLFWQKFLFQFQCLKETLLGQSHVARLFADGA